MRNKNKCSIFSIAIINILLSLVPYSISAQVSIGTSSLPVKGSLLQLKEDESPNVNSSKGMLLPRVAMIATKPADGQLASSIRASGTWDADSHVGLTVYNVNKGCVSGGQEYMYPGIYIWDGSKWESLTPPKKEDVRMVTYIGDNQFTMTYADENETYYYADFGEAGIWMTQNLRTRYTPEGIAMESTDYQSTNGLDGNGQPQKRFAYPGHGGDKFVGDTYRANVAAGIQIGLLYDFFTATDHKNCSTVDQGQVAGSTPGSNEVESREENGRIQGICPQGWHLPSDRELNLLEKELTEHASLYTQTPATVDGTWNPAWDTSTGNRGGAALAYAVKSKQAMINQTYQASYANSKKASEGGFDFNLTGFASTAAPYGGFGVWGYLLTSSGSTYNGVYTRSIYCDYAYVGRQQSSPRHHGLAVRCKKD